MGVRGIGAIHGVVRHINHRASMTTATRPVGVAKSEKRSTPSLFFTNRQNSRACLRAGLRARPVHSHGDQAVSDIIRTVVAPLENSGDTRESNAMDR